MKVISPLWMHLVGPADTANPPGQHHGEVREVIQRYEDPWDTSVMLAHYQALAYLDDGADCKIP